MKHYLKPETESFQTTPNTTLCASANVGVTLGTMKVKSFPEPNKSPILVFALMLSGMFLLPSCKSGNGDVQQPSAFKKGEVVTITTNPIGAGNKTPRKVHVKDETGEGDNRVANMAWTEGDQLRVIVPSDGTPFPSSDFVLTAGANEETGTFTGTMPADGSEFFLAYPCGNITGSGWNESTHTFTFQGVSVPNVQDFTVGASSFNSGLMPVVGYGKDENGTLTGTTTIVGGALRVKLTNSTGKDLTFNKVRLYVLDARTKEDGEHTSVWGTYTVDYNIATKTATPSGISADDRNIVLNLSDKVTLANGDTSNDFYFVMLAPLYFSTSNGSSFVIYLYNYDGEVTSTSDLPAEAVATTSFNYNIAIAPGDIVEGTLVMTE